MDLNTVLLYQLGIFVGILFISVLPYLAKRNEIPGLPWENYYTTVMLYGYIIAVIGMFIVYKQNPLDPTMDPTSVFGEGLLLGLASTPTVKYLMKLLGYGPVEPE